MPSQNGDCYQGLKQLMYMLLKSHPKYIITKKEMSCAENKDDKKQ